MAKPGLKQELLVAGALVLGILIAFWPALSNGFTHWDDHLQVTENPDIRSLSNISTIFSSFYVGMYQPLTTLLFALEFTLFGLSPFAFHGISLLLHVLNSWLVYRFLQQLGSAPLAAGLAALLFAVHPMQVESVAWVSARSNLLYSAFYLLGLSSYIKYIEHENRKHLLFTLIFFIGSALAKSAAVTFPIALVLLDLYKQRSLKLNVWLEKIPLLAISVGFGVVTMIGRAKMEHLSDLSNDFTPFERILLPLHSLMAYPIRWLAPFELSAFYPYPLLDGQGLPWLYYATLGALLAILGLLFWRGKQDRNIWLGPLFYGLHILPVLQIIPVGSQPTADRYFYLSGLGVLLLLFSAAQPLGKWLRQFQPSPKYMALLLVPIGWMVLSHQQTQTWKDDLTLWNDVISKSEHVPVAWNNRGIMRKEAGRLPEAEQDFDRAIRLKPIYADAYSNRGTVRAALGKTQEAITDFGLAIKYRPDHADAYFNRANERIKLRDLPGALADFDQSIALRPSADAYSNRAYARLLSEDEPGAYKDLSTAIQLDPEFAAARYLRAQILVQQQKRDAACKDLQIAAQLGHAPAQQALKQLCR